MPSDLSVHCSAVSRSLKSGRPAAKAAAIIFAICEYLLVPCTFAAEPYSEAECRNILSLEGFFSRAEVACQYKEPNKTLENAAVDCYANFSEPDVPEQLLEEGKATFDSAASDRGLALFCAQTRIRKDDIVETYINPPSAPLGLDQAPTFDKFPALNIYRGPLHLPDFKSRDRDFRDYKDRILTGLKAGPNFAGKYSFIQFGCGTECTLVYIADNQTGQVFSFPRGGDDNLNLDLAFRLNSRLLIAQWSDAEGVTCNLEYFEWKKNAALLLTTTALVNRGVCLNRRASDPIR